MNIFVTSKSPLTCAQEHCNVHVVKMILETAQLLSTAHVELDGTQVAYKATHKNHPSALWVRKERSNYLWAFDLFDALLDEYTYRTGKVHKSTDFREILSRPPENISERFGCLTHFPKAMPDEFKQKCVETSYQDYLNAKFAEWRSRERPMKVEWTNRPKPVWVSL